MFLPQINLVAMLLCYVLCELNVQVVEKVCAHEES